MQSRAEPASTGTTFRWIVACRIAFRMSSGGIAASCMASSAISSEKSNSVDTSCSRQSAASSASSSGIGDFVTAVRAAPPASASSLGGNVSSCISTRSTMPRNGFLTCGGPSPSGRCSTMGVAPSRFSICPTVPKKSAPSRSSLLTRASLGTAYLSACRQTVSLWASTPSRALNTTTAPSSTRRLRSTSAVKSTWPGVSIRFTVTSRHGNDTAAE